MISREEYRDRIDNIEKLLKQGTDVNSELQELVEIKPVTLRALHLKALRECLVNKDVEYPNNSVNGKISLMMLYDGLEDILELQAKIQKQDYNNEFDSDRLRNIIKVLKGDFSFYEKTEKICEKSLCDCSNSETDFKVLYSFYAANDYLAYRIHREYRNKVHENAAEEYDYAWTKNQCNYGLLNDIYDAKGSVIVVSNEWNKMAAQIISRDIDSFGNKVICIPFESDDIERNQLIKKAVNELKMEGFPVYILADSYILDSAICSGDTELNIEKMCNEGMSYQAYNFSMGMVMGYVDYLSKLFCTDCKQLLEITPSVRFSIVIPARNSSETLRYTLKTCLEQDFDGEYEIIISDNSTGSNAAVYELCQELNDPRIVYIKTPRNLALSKSFEYAYIHTRGEYVFAIGSDDGMLPWALSELDLIVKRHSAKDVIQWERGFYAWPGFNGGQQNELKIPREYKKNNYNEYYKSGLDYIAQVMVKPAEMYGLPMLYINSCFKRSYMKKLLEKTGRLWDGVCQDLYMGVITAAINEKIMYVEFPLTIAGMSSASIGANANKGIYSNKEFEKLMQQRHSDDNIGGYCRSPYEMYIPSTGTDTYSLFSCIMRAVSLGLIPEIYLEQVIPWKEWYIQLAAELDVKDILFDAKIHEMRYCASLLGEEFLEWFDKGIYEYKTRPKVIENNTKSDKQKRSYQVGKDKTGQRIYDASEYGVTNVYEAVQLFVEKM